MQNTFTIEDIANLQNGAYSDHQDIKKYLLKKYNKYKGLSRTEFRRKNSTLARALNNCDLLDKVLPKENPFLLTKEEVLEEYSKKYKGRFNTRTELRRHANRIYSALGRVGLLDKLFPRKVPFPFKTKEEVLEVYNNHYKGLGRKELFEKYNRLYRYLVKFELIDDLIPRKVPLPIQSKKEATEKFKTEYKGKIKTRTELCNKDKRLHSFLLKNGLINSLLPSKRERKFRTREEATYEFNRKYQGRIKSAWELSQTNRKLYYALTKLGIIYELIPKSVHRWETKSDKEILQDCKSKYPNLSRTQLRNADPPMYAIMLKRKIIKYIPQIKRNWGKIRTSESFSDFVKDNETAKRLIAFGLSGNNGTLSEVVSSIVKSNPDKFDETTSLKIPRWINEGMESLMPYIGPFIFHNYSDVSDFLKYIYQNTKNKEIIVNVQNLASDVSRNMYMKEFNKDPKGTLRNLESSLETEKDPSVKGLMQKTYDYYSEISSYKIPGIKSIEETK